MSILDLKDKKFGMLTALRPTDIKDKTRSKVWECLCDCGKTVYMTAYKLQRHNNPNCGCADIPSYNDLTGQIFHYLKVIRITNESTQYGSRIWECRCKCGKTVYVSSHKLTTKKYLSCGCGDYERTIDITDQTFGLLKAIEPTENRDNGSVIWKCECRCKNTVLMPASKLVNNKNLSCGCLEQEHLEMIRNLHVGILKPVDPTDRKNKNGSVIWKCECGCGKTVYLPEAYLMQGNYKSCGCLEEKQKERIAGTNDYLHYVDGTCIEAIKNPRPSVNSTTGVRGVHKWKDKWRATIGFKRKTYHLGTFDNFEDAVNARKEAEEKLYHPLLEEFYKNIG